MIQMRGIMITKCWEQTLYARGLVFVLLYILSALQIQPKCGSRQSRLVPKDGNQSPNERTKVQRKGLKSKTRTSVWVVLLEGPKSEEPKVRLGKYTSLGVPWVSKRIPTMDVQLFPSVSYRCPQVPRAFREMMSLGGADVELKGMNNWLISSLTRLQLPCS